MRRGVVISVGCRGIFKVPALPGESLGSSGDSKGNAGTIYLSIYSSRDLREYASASVSSEPSSLSASPFLTSIA